LGTGCSFQNAHSANQNNIVITWEQTAASKMHILQIKTTKQFKLGNGLLPKCTFCKSKQQSNLNLGTGCFQNAHSANQNNIAITWEPAAFKMHTVQICQAMVCATRGDFLVCWFEMN
jgi:hypothetical protein